MRLSIKTEGFTLGNWLALLLILMLAMTMPFAYGSMDGARSVLQEYVR